MPFTSKAFGKAEGIKDTLRVPFDYDVACQTIQGSADSFYRGTWKICHHGREFNLWWYSPLQNTTAHL